MTQTTTPDIVPDYADKELIKPYKGDPCLGNLSTPINDSDLVKAFIGNLPAYREGLSPFMRGLEIGMAHGYFLIGLEIVFGPLRETSHGANLSGVITAIYIKYLHLIKHQTLNRIISLLTSIFNSFNNS